MPLDPKHLLDDDGMRRFIRDGFVSVRADLPPSLHQNVCRQVDEIFDKQGNPGNNLLPLVPEIQQVFDHPAVHGAMTSVLGPNYSMHLHRYCHLNRPGSEGQKFHKDTYAADEQVRHHRCRWTLAFYYPQDTTIDMGPSAILPTTQYYETKEAAHSQPEMPLCGEAGTVLIIHYDLWHRAMPNQSEKKRYMLKFLFNRTEEPQRPSWRSESPAWTSPESAASDHGHEEMLRQIWNWNLGGRESANRADPHAADVPALMASLADADEAVRLDAAYTLGAVGRDAVPALIEALHHQSEEVRQHACYALSAVGAPAAPALMEVLEDESAAVRAQAAFALGDIRFHDGDGTETAAALTRLLCDESEWARRHAAEALGAVGWKTEQTVPLLSELLNDEHESVRDNAARSLAKLGPAAGSAVPTLLTALNDESRYVRSHAVLALKRIGTSEAEKILLENLVASRWCPLTTADSPY